ncbi:11538_t:CDS:1, partial [Acaulospora colombiana]
MTSPQEAVYNKIHTLHKAIEEKVKLSCNIASHGLEEIVKELDNIIQIETTIKKKMLKDK